MTKSWRLRGCDTADEFDNFRDALSAITTIDAALNGCIDGPDGRRYHSDELTMIRMGHLSRE